MSAQVNADYGLRVPDDTELIQAFGSLRYAKKVTGGDLPTQCFYLANKDRIPEDEELRAVIAAWQEGPTNPKRKKTTVADVVRRTGFSWYKANKLLREVEA